MLFGHPTCTSLQSPPPCAPPLTPSCAIYPWLLHLGLLLGLSRVFTFVCSLSCVPPSWVPPRCASSLTSLFCASCSWLLSRVLPLGLPRGAPKPKKVRFVIKWDTVHLPHSPAFTALSNCLTSYLSTVFGHRSLTYSAGLYLMTAPPSDCIQIASIWLRSLRCWLPENLGSNYNVATQRAPSVVHRSFLELENREILAINLTFVFLCLNQLWLGENPLISTQLNDIKIVKIWSVSIEFWVLLENSVPNLVDTRQRYPLCATLYFDVTRGI